MSHFPSDAFRFGAANRDPEEEALGWVVRLTSGEITEEDGLQFAYWCASTENSVAYARASRLWVELGPLLERQEETGWQEHAPPPARSARFARLLRPLAVAASLALAAISGAQYMNVWRYDYVSGSAVSQEFRLTDGSHVTMGPGTALNLDFKNGARHVSLARGEAYFDVRHDPAHPFVVSSGNGLVRVLGTAFSVRRDDDGLVTLTVTRGRVGVISGARTAIVGRDRQISYNADRLGALRAVDSSLAIAWTRGRLIRENQPLAEVLAELNRYRGGKIVLLNTEAGERRINAVIDLNKIDSWLSALASSQGLKLTDLGPVAVLR